MVRARVAVLAVASFTLGCGSVAANPIVSGDTDSGRSPLADVGGGVDGAEAVVDSIGDAGVDPVPETSFDAGPHDDSMADTTVETCEAGPGPTFAGLVSIDEVSSSSVHLHWAAASTWTTYRVFVSGTPGGEDLGKPTAVTAAGATDFVVSGLSPATTYYFVVRAEDCAGTVDSNTVERSATTLVSYPLNIEPLFRDTCAKSGCHSGAAPPSGLNLSPGVAYPSIVGVVSAEDAPTLRVKPGDSANSYLYRKLLGPGIPGAMIMPPSSTGPVLTVYQTDLVKDWIDQGAHP